MFEEGVAILCRITVFDVDGSFFTYESEPVDCVTVHEEGMLEVLTVREGLPREHVIYPSGKWHNVVTKFVEEG